MDMGTVKKIDIDHEMQQSYLDYAMSVIVSRALPDARDGLKPVQRRLLYAMYDMGIRADTSYKKSARIVGEVLGKYHPHGDQAVYESMARMAQDFSMRYALIDGQGNFGSVDGDPPAAMRYTEARITPFALDLLNQLDRNTVNFDGNFDGTLEEPNVLPSALPNMLVNGATGIAVGMATSIPPHNLGEITDALIYLLEHWQQLDDITVGDLMKYVQGPDFPTGGIILQEHEQNELNATYATGKGRITLRGRLHLEEMARGKSKIIVTELPYMVNKSALIERIAELSREGALEGVSDLRDESDRQGMRIVIELNKAADADKTLRALYKRTPLQVTYSINLLALVNGEPKLLSLKQALKVFIEHRLDVVRRRSEFDLKKAEDRIHILEGLRIAIKFLDEVILLIRASQDSDEAKEKLIKKFKLSNLQAQAILDMPLKRLASLERRKLEQEYNELVALVKELQLLLKSDLKRRQMVITELTEMRNKYADRRKTQIVMLKQGTLASDLLTVKDVTPVENVWIAMSKGGKISKMADSNPPRLGGREAPIIVIRSDSHQNLYLASKSGKCACIAVQTLQTVEEFENGMDYHRIAPFNDGDVPITLFCVSNEQKISETICVTTLSQQGMIKKSLVSDLPGPSSDLFVLAKINEGDELRWALLTEHESNYLIITQLGMAIRFGGNEVRAMGLIAAGVNALKLSEKDVVAGIIEISSGDEILAISSDGKGWRMGEEVFPLQGRYGQGVNTCKLKPESTIVGLTSGKKNTQISVHTKKAAAKMIRLDEIPTGKRATGGKALIDLKAGDEVQRMVVVVDTLNLFSQQKKSKK
ncbi:MAG: DNA topoisomerase 4 subunit A [Chloroflexi bacterium]|nr:DNA topoisomerase 4 subunit A [Chloroflexota bacterium]